MPYYLIDGKQVEYFNRGCEPVGGKRLKNADAEAMLKARAREQLRAILKPGDTVACILRHCSRSGMRRHISLVTESMQDITFLAAQAMGESRADDGGIKVDGCGMDMGFSLVYNLGRVLFPEGFAVTGRGRNGDTSGRDTDGGYALKHRWL